MNSKIKKKWLKALRSGKYKQGKDVLAQCDAEGNKFYCCLGVLMDVLGTEQLDPVVTDYTENENKAIPFKGTATHLCSFEFPEDTTGLTLSHEAIYEAQLQDANPSLKVDNQRSIPISELNDDEGMSFNDIADLIEAQL